MLNIILKNILNHDFFSIEEKKSIQKLNKNYFEKVKFNKDQVHEERKKIKLNAICTEEEKYKDKNIFSYFLNNYLVGICHKKSFFLDLEHDDVNILSQVKKK